MLLMDRPGAERAALREAHEARPLPILVSEEREFSVSEMFFSTTDRKGIIRSGNRVFVRVSGYDREQLVGRPHNIIRHPDMPRSVFRLLWEELEAGRPFAGYVKNRASDGRHYWVLATIVPCAGGYLSVRVKPVTTYFATAQALYPLLLEVEHQVEDGDPHRRKEAMDAARTVLGERLQAAGFPTYEAFMRAALLTELQQRAASGRQRLAPDVATADSTLHAILRSCTILDAFLESLVGRLDHYAHTTDQLGEKAHGVRDLADDVGLFAMNARIAATRLADGGATLGAVAELMQSQSTATGPVFQGLFDDVAATVDLLERIVTPIGFTKLQAEMLVVFVHELLDSADGERATADDLGALATCLVDGVEQVTAALIRLQGYMDTLAQHVAGLKSALKVLRALGLQGRVEAARVDHAEGVVSLFHTMADQIEAATRDMDALLQISRVSCGDDVSGAKRCAVQVEGIRRHIAQIDRVTRVVP